MLKVKLITDLVMVGQGRTALAGEVVTLPKSKAKYLIAEGRAEKVEGKQKEEKPKGKQTKEEKGPKTTK